jgi:hypothetical protein
MVKIYRMWRYVRIVERRLFDESKIPHTQTDTSECNDDFCQEKTVFGRKYKRVEGVKAAFMADKRGYITVTQKQKMEAGQVGITAEGMIFNTVSGLMEAWAKSIISVPSVVAIVISVAALVVALEK